MPLSDEEQFPESVSPSYRCIDEVIPPRTTSCTRLYIITFFYVFIIYIYRSSRARERTLMQNCYSFLFLLLLFFFLHFAALDNSRFLMLQTYN